MAFDLLLGLGRLDGSVEIRELPLAQHHRENAERELRLIVGQPLELRREQPELELPASLHRLEVGRAILVSLALSCLGGLLCGDDPSLECLAALRDLVDGRHVSVMIDERSAVNADSIARSLWDAADDHRERTRVDRDERPVRRRRIRQLEERAVQPLVEDAVAVVIEPENLQAIAALAREDEERATLGIEREALAYDQRESVKRAAHILSLRAHEDAHRCRDHRRCSRTSSS
jgi:hypothetical protein